MRRGPIGRRVTAEERTAQHQRRAERACSVGAIIERYLAEPEVKARRSVKEIQRYLRTIWLPIHEVEASAETIALQQRDVVSQRRTAARRACHHA